MSYVLFFFLLLLPFPLLYNNGHEAIFFFFFSLAFLADWCKIQVLFSHDEPLHRTCYAGHFGSHILDSAHVVSPTRYGWRRAKAQGRLACGPCLRCVSLRFSPGFLMSVQFSYAWHAQARVDYGARVKLGAIARIRFGIDVYGMSDCLHVLIYAWIGGFCSRRCSVPTWERRCHTF